MLFQTFVADEDANVATVRQVCGKSLAKFSNLIEKWNRNTESHDSIRKLDHAEKKLYLGAIIMSAITMGQSRLVPGPDPESLLTMLSDEKRKPPHGLFVSKSRRSEHERKEKALNVVEAVLCQIPGFDQSAARAGRPQSDQVMAQLSIDYPIMREGAFAISMPWATMMEMEQPLFEIGRVWRNFEAALLHGIDGDELVDYIDRNSSPEKHAEMEPA